MGFESIGRKRKTAGKLIADCCPGHTNYGYESHEWKKKQSRYERRLAKLEIEIDDEPVNTQSEGEN